MGTNRIKLGNVVCGAHDYYTQGIENIILIPNIKLDTHKKIRVVISFPALLLKEKGNILWPSLFIPKVYCLSTHWQFLWDPGISYTKPSLSHSHFAPRPLGEPQVAHSLPFVLAAAVRRHELSGAQGNGPAHSCAQEAVKGKQATT